MKKIMFSDKFGLTEAVLDKIKTNTRRSISNKLWEKWDEVKTADSTEEDLIRFLLDNSPYKLGEVVAVAQSYASIVDELEDPKNFCCMEHWESAGPKRAHYAGFLYHPGMTNKMFVSAKEMPHQIRITDVRVERLQDISDEDCIAEGVCKWTKDKELFKYDMADGFEMFEWGDMPRTPREAYAALMDRISSKGTFESNPYVFVYEFELVK